MNAGCDVRTYLRHEARGLVSRLGHVRPFSLHETMVPAAAISPAALRAVERYLAVGRQALLEDAKLFLDLLDGDDSAHRDPEELQRGLTGLRLRFNVVLSEFDIFAQALTQRSEHGTGVWLSGLDAVADDALRCPAARVAIPPVVCYLERGFGAAIRRARTRLPGGGLSPVAIIRVPRERMVGVGIGASLLHEVGHQAAALLDLLRSLRPALREAAEQSEVDTPAWGAYERWISEITSDLWSVSKLGITATLGLMAVVNLPRPFVFRANTDGVHPTPWLRVKLSCAMGEHLYPHPQWKELAALWEKLYPLRPTSAADAEHFSTTLALMPELVEILVGHRPAALGGASLREALVQPGIDPESLRAQFARWRQSPFLMFRARPTRALAVLGQGRFLGLLSPEEESRTIGQLLNHWALRSSLGGGRTAGAPPCHESE